MLKDTARLPLLLRLTACFLALGMVSLALAWRISPAQQYIDWCLIGFSMMLTGFMLILVHCNPYSTSMMRPWVGGRFVIAMTMWLLALLGTLMNGGLGLRALYLLRAGIEDRLLFTPVTDIVLALLILPFIYLGTAISIGKQTTISHKQTSVQSEELFR